MDVTDPSQNNAKRAIPSTFISLTPINNDYDRFQVVLLMKAEKEAVREMGKSVDGERFRGWNFDF
jgi:hypothetical protein